MPDFTFTLFDVTANVLNAVASIAAPIAAGLGIRYLNKRFNLDIDERVGGQLVEAATRAVQAQEKRKVDNSRKKLDAVESVRRQASLKSVADKAIDEAVEAAVYRVKGA